MAKGQCGFLSVVYFYCIINNTQLQQFEQEYGANGINPKTWRNTKKKRRLELIRSTYYMNNGTNGEMDRYLEYFNLDQYKKLDRRERDRHTLKSCVECQKNKHLAVYRLRRENATDQRPLERLHDIMGREPETPQQCREFVGNVTEAANRVLQGSSDPKTLESYLKRKANDPRDVSSTAKRKIIQSERVETEARLQKPEFVALYTSAQSEREYMNQRKRRYGEFRKNRNKSHVAKVESYNYDEGLLTAELIDADDVNKLNYTKLAREVNLRRNGIMPKNSGQVMKEIARSMGFEVKIKSHKRISWMNYKRHKLNVQRQSSVSKLKDMKRDMIRKGEIDIGEMIVPIDYYVMTINKDGTLEKTKHTVAGRKFNLKSVRKDHLQRMKELGVLRETDVAAMTEDEISDMLRQNGEVVMSDPAYNEERLCKLVHTRHLLCWHDHSDILGKSHYLFVVWFLYDPITFHTDEEYQKLKELTSSNVQNMVEQPYVYLLAQSASAVKDQLLYVPTRLEDIDDLGQNLEIENVNYEDKLRLFSGDTPARQLEAGQQCGGSYPCFCGLLDKKFADAGLFNSQAKFNSIKERLNVLHQTETWHKSMTQGQLAPFDTMKVKELRKELEDRNILFDAETAAELKGKLMKCLKGIKRPPALLCTGRELQTIAGYDISMVEPLHDIKNCVNRVFDELPHAITETELKATIKETLELLKVQNREMKGSDCRLNIVKLASVIYNKPPTKESHLVLRLLLSLIELQQCAYAQERERSPRTVLRAYNQSFVFATAYIQMFANPKSNSHRAMFGMPFHALAVHLAETLRLINGRSIVAEQAERHFSTLRQLSLRTSNRKNEHVITNALFRLSVQRINNTSNTSSFETQQSKVSRACKGLALGANTTFSNQFLKSNHTATLNHLKRIADYLELGPGVWYKVDDQALTFFDGDQELNERAGPTLAHFRSTTAQDMQKKLEKSWDDCLKQREHLDIPILTSLNEKEHTPQTSQMGLPKRPSLSASLMTPDKDGRKSASTSSSPILVAAPCVTKNYIAPQREPVGENATLDPPSCSAVIVTKKKKAKPVESELPTCSRDTKSGAKSSKSKRVHTKEDATREAWSKLYEGTTALDTYFATKEQLSKNSSTLYKMKYKSACRTLRPMLQKVKEKILEIEKAETMKQFQQTQILKLDSSSEHKRHLTAIVSLIQCIESVLGIK